ncbi:hypothetical protein IC235_03225 [Hymenobacter sp. BT664]|uniref:Uncharacterized protein n=1 Tax=Hymenobacter montanus TaxID=2771359 RepID=A0A927GI09_9BACT|nr:hypothetical protein [Hymenobacter montanus]MBD2766902.1 hypothetical protein [Hymenobacter montanus]
MEDYAAKMLLKTDAALREYVTGHAQYREAAVLAALDELRRRGHPAPEEAALRPGLEAAATAQRAREEAAETERRSGAAGDNLEEADPALYSPVSIVLFSVLPMFTMLTGGVLMGMNLYRLGKKRATLGLAFFVIAYLYIGSLLFSWAVLNWGLSPVLGVLLFNLPAALAYVLWFWPRYVGATSFRSRNVLVPIMVWMLLAWGLQRITPYLIRQQPKEVRQQLERMMPPNQ